MTRLRVTYWFFLSIPWVAALAWVDSAELVGALRFTGALWIATWLVGVALILVNLGQRNITFPWRCWAPFFFYSFLSLAFREHYSFRDFQLGIQMTAFLIVGIVASFVVRTVDELKPLNWIYFTAAMIIGGACLYFMYGPGLATQSQEQGFLVRFAARPAGTTLVMIGAIFLAQLQQTPIKASAAWLLCLSFCILTGGRMASMALIMLWIVHPGHGRLLGRRLLLASVVAFFAVVAFKTPIIQERFFSSQSGFSGTGDFQDVAEGNFDGAGRFEAWPLIFAEANNRPLFGHGLASSAPFVEKVWEGIDKPHNEYLKVYFEGGIVGLALFSLAIMGTWWNVRGLVRQSRGTGNWAAQASYMGLFAFVVLAAVDNPLVYGNNFMHPLFALIGAANGIVFSDQSKRHWRGDYAQRT